MELNEVYLVPVEVRFVGQVRTLLEQLRADSGRGVEPSTPVAGRAGRRLRSRPGTVWDADLYRAFAEAPQTSYVRVRSFMDELARRRDEWGSITDACAAAGLSVTELRAALGKFTTWMQTVGGTDAWPFGWVDDQVEFQYKMTDDQARAWQTVSQEPR